MNFRLASILFGVVVATAAGAAWIGLELVMAPEGAERARLVSTFAAIGSAVFLVGLALFAVTRHSISRRILAVGIAGPLIVAVTTLFGAWSSFISSHDTQFVIILTALATALAVGLVQLLAAPLLRDLQRINSALERFATGDMTARTALERTDELGALGAAFDSMALGLQQSTAERERLERERRFLLNSLSHDARTPLTAMRAAIEALQDGLASDPARYLDSIEHDLHSIEAIVENIFVLGKLDAQQLRPFVEPLDLAELARTTAGAMEPLAQKRDVEIIVVADAEVPVHAARIETTRIIGNLISNAIRHSPEGGEVRVRIDAGSSPKLAVSDEGSGFPAEFVDNAFDPFARAEPDRNRAHGGAGLGLAVVKGLAEAMGGRVWAEPGPGGKVFVELSGAT